MAAAEDMVVMAEGTVAAVEDMAAVAVGTVAVAVGMAAAVEGMAVVAEHKAALATTGAAMEQTTGRVTMPAMTTATMLQIPHMMRAMIEANTPTTPIISEPG